MRKNVVRIAMVVGLILLVPLFGNSFIEGWNWSFSDFIVAGVLFFVTGLAIDWAARKITSRLHRVLAIVAILGVLLLVWVGMVANVGERVLEAIFCGGVC